MMSEPLGEVGANFSLQLLSQTQFTKFNNKKVIAENQCEKTLKKLEFRTYVDFSQDQQGRLVHVRTVVAATCIKI